MLNTSNNKQQMLIKKMTFTNCGKHSKAWVQFPIRLLTSATNIYHILIT